MKINFLPHSKHTQSSSYRLIGLFYVALVIQHAKRMHCITYYTVMCGLSGSKHFSALPHKYHNFQKEVTQHETCFDFLYNFYLKQSLSKLLS